MHPYACAESLDDFKQAQAQSMQAFIQAEENDFDEWQKIQNALYNQWSKEASQHRATHVKKIMVQKEGKQAVVRRATDFGDGAISIDIVTGNKDSVTAVKKIKEILDRRIAQALAVADSEAIAVVPKQKIDHYIHEIAQHTPVTIAKKKDTYIASLSHKQKLHGEKSVMKLIAQEGGKDTVISANHNNYSSLIVDARDVDFEACLVPSIVGSAGKVLYGPTMVIKKYAVNGMASWVTSLDDAQDEKKCGINPLMVTAVAKPARRRIALNAQEAQMVISLHEKTNVLRKCRVIIVTQ